MTPKSCFEKIKKVLENAKFHAISNPLSVFFTKMHLFYKQNKFEMEGGLYYIGGAYILVFIGNGANLAHLFRKRAKRQK
jgi:hypothetical protein